MSHVLMESPRRPWFWSLLSLGMVIAFTAGAAARTPQESGEAAVKSESEGISQKTADQIKDILDRQHEILAKLDEITKELQVIKIRATQR